MYLFCVLTVTSPVWESFRFHSRARWSTWRKNFRVEPLGVQWTKLLSLNMSVGLVDYVNSEIYRMTKSSLVTSTEVFLTMAIIFIFFYQLFELLPVSDKPTKMEISKTKKAKKVLDTKVVFIHYY